MAGDWIKMRVSLVTHPRVIALSEAISYNADYQDWSGLHGFVPAIGGTKEEYDADLSQSLRVTRYVVVTALLKFWGYANEHVKDEFIPNLRIADLDEITSVPGFGAALEQIGWAIYDAERRGISLPNFNEHNSVASDRTAAERQKRYRDNKKREAESNGVTGDVTRYGNSNDREEKRREEKNTKLTAPLALPVWLNAETWKDYCKHRGAKFTDKAKALTLKKLGEFKAVGHEPNAILETSIANGWRGIFEPKAKGFATTTPPSAAAKIPFVHEEKKPEYERANPDLVRKLLSGAVKGVPA